MICNYHGVELCLYEILKWNLLINSPEHSRNTSQSKRICKNVNNWFMVLIVVPAGWKLVVGSPDTNKQRHSLNTRTDLSTSCHLMECMDQFIICLSSLKETCGKDRWKIIQIDLVKTKQKIVRTYSYIFSYLHIQCNLNYLHLDITLPHKSYLILYS